MTDDNTADKPDDAAGDKEPREDWCTDTTEQTLGGAFSLLRGARSVTARDLRKTKKRPRNREPENPKDDEIKTEENQ